MFLYTVPTGRAVLGMPQYGAQSQSPVATKSRQDLQLEVKVFYYIFILRSISLQVIRVAGIVSLVPTCTQTAPA